METAMIAQQAKRAWCGLSHVSGNKVMAITEIPARNHSLYSRSPSGRRPVRHTPAHTKPAADNRAKKFSASRRVIIQLAENQRDTAWIAGKWLGPFENGRHRILPGRNRVSNQLCAAQLPIYVVAQL